MSSQEPLALQDFGPDLHVDVADAVPPPSVSILGIPLAITDYERTMDWMDATIVDGGQGYVCVAATHTVMACQEDPDLREAVVESDLTVPDGQPLVWAMNALGHNLTSRVYGPDLMARYCERSVATGTKMFLYGGRNQGALVQLALNLRRRYPGVQIVGGYAPPYRPLTDEEHKAIVAEINGSGADVVWVGIGVPKQEKWMAEMRPDLTIPVLIGVGAAFDFHAGLVPQAPAWLSPWGWNGPTACRASRAGCGSATYTSIRASSPASRGSG